MERFYATVDVQGRATAFYSDQIHGPRLKEITDPAFDAATEWPRDEEGYQLEDFEPPTLEVANPDCLIPSEAFEIPEETWKAWRNGSGTLAWDQPTQTLVPYQPTLQESQGNALEDIDAERYRRCYPGRLTVTVTGIGDLPIDLRSTEDRSNLAGLGARARYQIQLGQQLGLLFRDADNAEYTLDVAQAAELAFAVEDHIQQVYQTAWDHKQQILAFSDAQAVQGYDLTANWPVGA